MWFLVYKKVKCRTTIEPRGNQYCYKFHKFYLQWYNLEGISNLNKNSINCRATTMKMGPK